MGIDVVTIIKEFGTTVGFLVVCIFALMFVWKYYTKELKGMADAHKKELADIYCEHKLEISKLHESHKKDIQDLFNKIQTLYDEKLKMAKDYQESIVRLTDLLERK